MAPLVVLLRFLLTLRGVRHLEHKLARNRNFRERTQNWRRFLSNRDCTGLYLATWRFSLRNGAALPSPANCLAFCLSYLLTIYALLLVPVQDFIGLFKVLIVLSTVLALYSLFIQVVDEHGERSQELRQAKEREWQADYYCKCHRVQPKPSQ